MAAEKKRLFCCLQLEIICEDKLHLMLGIQQFTMVWLNFSVKCNLEHTKRPINFSLSYLVTSQLR